MPSKKRKRSKISASESSTAAKNAGRQMMPPPVVPRLPDFSPPQPLMAPFMRPPVMMTPFGAVRDLPPSDAYPRQRGSMPNTEPAAPQTIKYYDCKVCNIRGMVYSIENMDHHFTSEAHKHMKVFYDNDMWPGRKGTQERPQIYIFVDTTGSIKCELCRSTQKNGTELLKHQHQPLHLKLLHELKLHTKIPVLFACNVCDVGIRGHDAYLAHNSSLEHLSAINAKAPEVTSVAPVKELSSTTQQLMPAPSTQANNKAPSNNNFLSLNDKFTTELLTNLVTSLKSMIDATDKSDLLIAAMIKNEQDFTTSDAAATIRQTLLGKIAQECKIRQQSRRMHELSILKILVETLQVEHAKSSVHKATKELFRVTMSDAEGMRGLQSRESTIRDKGLPSKVEKRRSRSPRKSPKVTRYNVPRSRSRSPRRDRYSMNYASRRGPRTPPMPANSSKPYRNINDSNYIDDAILPNGKRFKKIQQPVITLKDSPSPPSQSINIPGLGDNWMKHAEPRNQIDKPNVPELMDNKVAKPTVAKSKLSIELRSENGQEKKNADSNETKLIIDESNDDQKLGVESKQSDKHKAGNTTKNNCLDEKPVEVIL